MSKKQIAKLKELIDELRKTKVQPALNIRAAQLIQYLSGVLDGIPDKK